jgi:uncharacterized RDD family membrane protein YckC
MNQHQDFYAAPQATLQPEEFGMSIYGGAVLASRWARLGARTIDGMIYMVPVIPGVIGLFLFDNSAQQALMFVLFGLSALFMLGILGVNVYLLATRGQTLGRKAMGIRIVRGDLTTKVSLSRLFFLRYLPVALIGMIPAGFVVQFGNFLMIFAADQRCGHDHIADTHVIVDTKDVPDNNQSMGQNDFSGLGF